MNKDSDIDYYVDKEGDLFYSKRPGVEARLPLATDKRFPSPVGPSILWHNFFPVGVSRGKVFGKVGGVLLKITTPN